MIKLITHITIITLCAACTAELTSPTPVPQEPEPYLYDIGTIPPDGGYVVGGGIDWADMSNDPLYLYHFPGFPDAGEDSGVDAGTCKHHGKRKCK
jgi:hypothetical protein